MWGGYSDLAQQQDAKLERSTSREAAETDRVFDLLPGATLVIYEGDGICYSRL